MGQEVTGLIFFGNCAPKAGSTCRLTATMTIRRIEGALVSVLANIPVWTKPVRPPDGVLVLGEVPIVVKFDAVDAVGHYRIDVMLVEGSSGASSTLTWDLEVTR